MENQQKKENGFLKPTEGNAADTNTTNPNIESHKQKEEEGYKIAMEDTMIGYDGHEDQLDVDLGDGNSNTQNTRGVDDND
ncbi:hypothetical protein KHS38_02155 [Mucilaginibacter sp. Bleaf8]|uniref:hypothetical protein n=1 Tax=Mucilaginibacter sp. Bleaf8 TaxID=2834430 RepID=UPI001BCE9AA9|nr:hypothetical protein [Mucilaginibacter sp. Bleaf8]MBS7563196.1 hypothetical protein [Mucilaginibacter sp. Bleaf8]